MFGSQAATLEFLESFAVSPNCGFLWHSRLAGSKSLPQGGTHPLYHTMVHLIEETARSELPAVTSAFRLSVRKRLRGVVGGFGEQFLSTVPPHTHAGHYALLHAHSNHP